MKITYANIEEYESINIFFDENIIKADFPEHYYEYFCPYGLKAAIKREQVIVLKDDDKILGALRFYPRKKEKLVSLYQFALSEQVRWKGILEKMLKFTWYNNFWFQVFIDMSLNYYFEKKNWSLNKTEKEFNYWQLNI